MGHYKQSIGFGHDGLPKTRKQTLKHAALVDGWHAFANGVESTGVWHAWRHRGSDTVWECAADKHAAKARSRCILAAHT